MRRCCPETSQTKPELSAGSEGRVVPPNELKVVVIRQPSGGSLLLRSVIGLLTVPKREGERKRQTDSRHGDYVRKCMFATTGQKRRVSSEFSCFAYSKITQ